VALHEERVEEERKGVVRWLRPDYQQPRFGAAEERVEGLQLTPGRQLQQLRQRRTAGPGRETPLVKWAPFNNWWPQSRSPLKKQRSGSPRQSLRLWLGTWSIWP
jgi:hypothetical protein